MLTPQLGFGSIQTIVGIFLVFGLMFINLVVVIRRRRKIMSTMYSAPTTNGLTDYKLTSNTIEIKSTGHKATYYWSHILDAIPTPQGVLILIGQLEFIQIPNASLPEELSKEEFIALLRNWIKDSRK